MNIATFAHHFALPIAILWIVIVVATAFVTASDKNDDFSRPVRRVYGFTMFAGSAIVGFVVPQLVLDWSPSLYGWVMLFSVVVCIIVVLTIMFGTVLKTVKSGFVLVLRNAINSGLRVLRQGTSIIDLFEVQDADGSIIDVTTARGFQLTIPADNGRGATIEAVFQIQGLPDTSSSNMLLTYYQYDRAKDEGRVEKIKEKTKGVLAQTLLEIFKSVPDEKIYDSLKDMLDAVNAKLSGPQNVTTSLEKSLGFQFQFSLALEIRFTGESAKNRADRNKILNVGIGAQGLLDYSNQHGGNLTDNDAITLAALISAGEAAWIAFIRGNEGSAILGRLFNGGNKP